MDFMQMKYYVILAQLYYAKGTYVSWYLFIWGGFYVILDEEPFCNWKCQNKLSIMIILAKGKPTDQQKVKSLPI